MKKLLEKPWAKALAFLLTLLPGTAAVYGGVELVYICVYNMHTDRRLDMLWAVTAVCAVVAAASLVFSLSAAGHWPGHEGIHLTWVEKIPVDLFVLGLTCVWYIYLDAVYYPSATLGLAVFVALAYLFVLAFTARCKAGTVLSDLLALRLLRSRVMWPQTSFCSGSCFLAAPARRRSARMRALSSRILKGLVR